MPLRLHPDIRLFSAIPEERSLTAETRVLLPGQVSHEDARFNVSRAALLVVALTERPDLLMAATEDVLHQPPACPGDAGVGGISAAVAASWSGSDAFRGGPVGDRAEHRAELPAEALEYGAANGFTVTEMTVGEGVRWSPGVSQLPELIHSAAGGFACFRPGCGLFSVPSSNRSVCICADT